jgi:hypothetical protein
MTLDELLQATSTHRRRHGLGAVDRRRRHEEDRGSLRIEGVGVVTAWALRIGGISMRLTAPVWIEGGRRSR